MEWVRPSCPICETSLGQFFVPHDKVRECFQQKCVDCKRAEWIVDELAQRIQDVITRRWGV